MLNLLVWHKNKYLYVVISYINVKVIFIDRDMSDFMIIADKFYQIQKFANYIYIYTLQVYHHDFVLNPLIGYQLGCITEI